MVVPLGCLFRECDEVTPSGRFLVWKKGEKEGKEGKERSMVAAGPLMLAHS